MWASIFFIIAIAIIINGIASNKEFKEQLKKVEE
jgi:hypothetical protein